MMAVVASKRQIEMYIRMFGQAGIKVKTVLPQEMALIQLVKGAKAMPVGDDYFFVDLGQQFTGITVVWQDRVQAMRRIAIAGRHLDQVVSDEMGIDMFLAGAYRAANHQNVLSIPAVGDLCERIAVEILKVINFYQFTYRTSELPGIYITGGGAGLAPLRRAIAETTGLPLLDPSEFMSGLVEGNGAEGIFAAGAAMGGV